MLPEPEKVARMIKRVFKSAAEKRREDELNRNVQIRMGKAHLQRHIQNQRKMAVRLRALAKRALSLNDEARFRQVGRQLLWTQADIRRWEQYLLSLELLQARRDQARASVGLLTAIRAMSESLAEMAGPQDMAALQRELEAGLARASNLDERMSVMMELMDATLASDMPVDEGALERLGADMTDEIAAEENSSFDPEIEAGLRKIREELQQERK